MRLNWKLLSKTKQMAITRRNIAVVYGLLKSKKVINGFSFSLPHLSFSSSSISQCSLNVQNLDIWHIWIRYPKWLKFRKFWLNFSSCELVQLTLFLFIPTYTYRGIRSKKIPFHTFHFVELYDGMIGHIQNK